MWLWIIYATTWDENELLHQITPRKHKLYNQSVNVNESATRPGSYAQHHCWLHYNFQVEDKFRTHGESPPNPVICKCTSKLISNKSLQKAPCVHTSILRAQKMLHICRCPGERQRVPVTIETLPLLLAGETVREERAMSRCLLSILRINDSWTNKLQIFLFINHVFITMLDTCPAFCFRMQDK